MFYSHRRCVTTYLAVMPDTLTYVLTPYGTLHLIPDGHGGATGFLALPAALTRHHPAPMITLPRQGVPVIDDPFLDPDLRGMLSAALHDLTVMTIPAPPHVTSIRLDAHSLHFIYASNPITLHYDYGYFTVTWGEDGDERWAVTPDGLALLDDRHHTPAALTFMSDLHAALADRTSLLGRLLKTYLHQREQLEAHQAEHARYWRQAL